MRAALLPLVMASLAAAQHKPMQPQPTHMPIPPWHERATVVVETFHREDGAGRRDTNATILVPVGELYRNRSALNEVSTLYLLDDEAVTCIPYISEIPTGPHGHPFTVGHPSVLSSDSAVIVGNILCTHAGP
ncbi:hypothetical protein F4823DRAFT_568613 [Ustulina deusta]|nr:hypothetical protein F4823DRAFT_568613 [Ustulina deusta]